MGNQIDIGEYQSLHKQIKAKVDAFLEVGRLLVRMRDSGLYKAEFKTFEAYCKEKFGWSRPHAYRLIDLARVDENLSPIGDIPKPKNEAQAREIAKAPPEKQAEVWQEAMKTASKDAKGEPKVTAAHVQKVVAQRVQPEEEIDFDPTPAPPPDPWKPYNEQLDRACELLKQAKEIIVRLPSLTPASAAFAAWIDTKAQRTFFDNAVTTYEAQRVARFATEREAKNLGDGRNFLYAYEATPKKKRGAA